MNLLKKTDDEIVKIAKPIWENLIKYTRNDTQSLILAGVAKRDRSSILETAKKTTITRIVEAGIALNIGIIWDGYDIISELTRRIENE